MGNTVCKRRVKWDSSKGMGVQDRRGKTKHPEDRQRWQKAITTKNKAVLIPDVIPLL